MHNGLCKCITGLAFFKWLMDVSQKNSKQKEGGRSDWRWSQRRLHVKWSDGTRTDETEWGIAIRGYAKAKRWGRKRKRSARLDSIASECEEVDENDEKEKETIHSLTG